MCARQARKYCARSHTRRHGLGGTEAHHYPPPPRKMDAVKMGSDHIRRKLISAASCRAQLRNWSLLDAVEVFSASGLAAAVDGLCNSKSVLHRQEVALPSRVLSYACSVATGVASTDIGDAWCGALCPQDAAVRARLELIPRLPREIAIGEALIPME